MLNVLFSNDKCFSCVDHIHQSDMGTGVHIIEYSLEK